MEAALAAEAAAGAVLEEGEAPAPSLAREPSGARTRHPVSRAAIDAMATKDMQEMFDVFDDDQGGTVEGSEFARHLNDSLGFALDQDGLDGLFDEVDTSGNGHIDREEWVKMMRGILHKLEKKPLSSADVRRVLESTLVPVEHRGAERVSLAAIQPGFAKLGVRVTAEQASGVMLSALGLGPDLAPGSPMQTSRTNRAGSKGDGPRLEDICEALVSLLRKDGIQSAVQSTAAAQGAQDESPPADLALFGLPIALEMDDVDIGANLGPLLQMVPLFANLDDEHFSRLTAICQRSKVRFKKGDAIVKQGEIGHEMFLLLSGNAYASLYSDEHGKKPIIVKNYSKGDYFGERALVRDDGKRMANIFVSSADALCCKITRQEFHDLVGGLDGGSATEVGAAESAESTRPDNNHLQNWRQQLSDVNAIEQWRTLIRRFHWLDVLHDTIDQRRTMQGRKMHTLSEADIRQEISARRFFYTPDAPFIAKWQLFQVLVLVITAIIVPLRAGFDQIDSDSPTFWFIFDLVSDLYFWFDIVLNFRTAYVDNQQKLEHRDKQVAWNYITGAKHAGSRACRFPLQSDDFVARFEFTSDTSTCNLSGHNAGWFIIDFSSVFPASYVLYILRPDSLPWRLQEDQAGDSTGMLKLLKILRLFRLTKMLKLLKMKELLEKHEDNELLTRFMGSVTVINLFIQLLYMCHFLACFFYLFGDISESDRPDGTVIHGWVYRQQWGAYGWGGRYLYSFFLSITDETSGLAETDAELLWSGMQHILYEAFLAYLTGVFAGEVISGNAAQQEYTAKMDQVKYFMQHYRLPHSLRKQVNAFYVHLNDTKTFFDEEAVLGEFPPAIRKKVIYHIYETIVDSHKVKIHYPFLSRLPERLRYELCRVLRPLSAGRGDVIYTEGEYGDEMYLVKHGQCVAYKWTGDTMEDHKRKLDERKQTIYATGQFEEGLTLHVRGIGGPTADPGVYEDAQALRNIFGAYGQFDDAVIRHRVDDSTGKNTSYALVTMCDAESAQNVLQVAATVGILRPDGVKLQVNPYSSKTAMNSSGAMRRTTEAVQLMGSRVQDAMDDDKSAPTHFGMHHPDYGERLGEFNDGSFFGEEALLGENVQRIATVVAAASGSHIWYLDRATCASFSRQEDVHLFNKELRSFARKRQHLNDLRAKRMAQLDIRLEAMKKHFSIAQMLAGGGLPKGARIPSTEELPMINTVFSPLVLPDVRDAVKFRCVALDFRKGDSVQGEDGSLSADASKGQSALKSGVLVLLSGELLASLASDSNTDSGTASTDGDSEQQLDAPRMSASRVCIKPGTAFSALASVQKIKKFDPDDSKQSSEFLPHPKGLRVSQVIVASEQASALWLDSRLFDFAHDPNSLEIALGELDSFDDTHDSPDDTEDGSAHDSAGRDLCAIRAHMTELKQDVDEKIQRLEQANASMQQQLNSKLDALLAALASTPPLRERLPRSQLSEDVATNAAAVSRRELEPRLDMELASPQEGGTTQAALVGARARGATTTPEWRSTSPPRRSGSFDDDSGSSSDGDFTAALVAARENTPRAKALARRGRP